MKKQNIISWIALALSIIACIITLIRVDVTVANDSFISMIAGFMGVCATLLVGSQIYNSIDISRRIKEIDNKLKETERAIQLLKEERDISEHYTKYNVHLVTGMSMSHHSPVYAFMQLFNALSEALYLKDAKAINKTFIELECLYDKMIRRNPFSPNRPFSYELYSPEKLMKYDLYPLIKDKYRILYEAIVKLYKQCQKKSESAS